MARLFRFSGGERETETETGTVRREPAQEFGSVSASVCGGRVSGRSSAAAHDFRQELDERGAGEDTVGTGGARGFDGIGTHMRDERHDRCRRLLLQSLD